MKTNASKSYFAAIRSTLSDLSRAGVKGISAELRQPPAHVCAQCDDVATASLIENWIDETESRVWFLHEIVHHA